MIPAQTRVLPVVPAAGGQSPMISRLMALGSGGFSAAMLVLLPAPAGTRVVPSHLRAGPRRFRLLHLRRRFAHHVASAPRRSLARRLPAEAGWGFVRCLARHVAQELLERHQARRAPENVVADLRLRVDHQLLENLERLRLVLDQRVPLPVRPQPDAMPEGCPSRTDAPATACQSPSGSCTAPPS